ncbi:MULTISPECIES: hypothetical protein [unclassified Streptomyces]|uniref:hypothetical protein n=1 Tax=unclassified Streptomyces TaxID=2593676 RepID=UPI00070085E8|nr:MULTISPECIES: hypothetical protein [unclassified Streptomyces]KQX59283.1 hypothetical protein ASD33_03030 [Streptomyces sp. Root1304]KRB00544.1 hypothetical protein ASE09_03030 [Streptomyces sp. Root66D1]
MRETLPADTVLIGAARTRIPGGWTPYADFVGIGDLDQDGRPDLLVNDTLATPSYFPGTGDWRAPFAAARDVYSAADWSGTTLF